MKFFSRITNKPNSVIQQVKDGLKVVSNKRICVFNNGEYETDDPKIIEILQAHPNQFATDHPWNPVGDKVIAKVGNKVEFELLKYKELLIKAKEAGINTYKMKKEAIVKALNEKGSELNGNVS